MYCRRAQEGCERGASGGRGGTATTADVRGESLSRTTRAAEARRGLHKIRAGTDKFLHRGKRKQAFDSTQHGTQEEVSSFSCESGARS